MFSKYEVLPKVTIHANRHGNDDFPSTPPSRQAWYWDNNTQTLYVVSDMMKWQPINHIYSEAITSTPPTKGELSAIFGNPEDIGKSFTATLNVGGVDEFVYHIISSGSEWFVTPMTKAL